MSEEGNPNSTREHERRGHPVTRFRQVPWRDHGQKSNMESEYGGNHQEGEKDQSGHLPDDRKDKPWRTSFSGAPLMHHGLYETPTSLET